MRGQHPHPLGEVTLFDRTARIRDTGLCYFSS